MWRWGRRKRKGEGKVRERGCEIPFVERAMLRNVWVEGLHQVVFAFLLA